MDFVTSSVGTTWRHEALDLRVDPAIDILVGDVGGDGRDDIVSGSRWYRAPHWIPVDVPGMAQAIALMDVDGDGKLEIVGVRGPGLTNRLCWTKYQDGTWQTYDIGEGDGDWPHGVAVLEDQEFGRTLLTSYHERDMHPPQIWTVPEDPKMPWHKATLFDLAHSEEMVVVDLDGDGRPEIVAGPWWLEYVDGAWQPHRFADETYDNVTRVRVVDLTGDGRLDILLTEETGDWESRDPGAGRVTLFSQPDDIRTGAWTELVIATKKCPHSLDVADINGDGRLEILIGEHDAFTPDGEAVNAGLFVYHAPRENGTEWTEETIDTRFEHFNGAKAINLGGTIGIVSHGWMEPRYLHLWQPMD